MKGMKPFWLVLSAVLLTACGGGGGGGGNGSGGIPEPPLTILPTYDFEIGGVQPGVDMAVDVGGQFQVGVDFGNTLLGRVNLQVNNQNDVTFLDFVTDADSQITVEVVGTETDLDGSFTIAVTTDVVAGIDDEPTSGDFIVVQMGEVVHVTITATGVILVLDGGMPVPLSWEEYDNLLDNAKAPTWQRRASLAGATFAFIFERVFEIAELLDDLELTESATPIYTTCDEFPGTPPVGVQSPGEHVLTRLGSGEDLSPGDIFDWTFTNCWFESSGYLIDNFLQMQNYIEDVDASNTLTRIGFGLDNNIGGGVLYFDWTVAETVENLGVYTIDPEDVIEVNGGFTMVFTRPQ